MNENVPTPDLDEMLDRLIDGSLDELLSEKLPPDLSERILAAHAAAAAPLAPAGELTMNPARIWTTRGRVPAWLIAASILIAVGALLFQTSGQRAREIARRDGKSVTAHPDRRANIGTAVLGKPKNKSGAVMPSKDEQMGRQIAKEQAGNSRLALLDSSVQHELDKDSTLSNYKQQLFAIDSKLQTKSSTGRNQNNEELRRLQAQREQTQQMMDAYQVQKEKNLWNEYAAQPNGTLSDEPAAAAPTPPAIKLYYLPTPAPAEGEALLREERARLGAAPQAMYGFPAQVGPGLRPEVDRLSAMYGRGAATGGDQYARIVDNLFQAISPATTDNRLSTFSIDVDTASYANVRQFLMQSGALPPPDAVRIEELVNYFAYDYSPPTGDVPFAAHVEVAGCPWNAEHRLVRIGIKGHDVERTHRPPSNLVFLVDVSGSMDEPNKLPLLIEGMKLLTRELGENDRVAIVVYASTEGLALDSTRGDQQTTILRALDNLHAGGSTAGGAGIQLAYKVAAEHFVKGGTNRVILCTDGDFNVGVTSTAELQRIAEQQAKETGVFLTVLGFGRGNLNDAMMEAIADKGNGNYHYVDGRSEARKVLVEEMTGTLMTIAKDVKIQVEFNPSRVAGYRLIGYENRVLAAEDFNDDKKDAGEIGAGHTVTALYEVVPAGQEVDATKVDALKYDAPKPTPGEAASAASPATFNPNSPELLTLKIRYKQPDGDTSQKLEFPIVDDGGAFPAATPDFRFAAAVAEFGMLLRDSPHKGAATLAAVRETAESALGADPHGYRREFLEMTARAAELKGE